MSRFGDKLRARLGKKSVKELEEGRAKKMEARKDAKAGRIKSRADRGKISKEKAQKKLDRVASQKSNRSARIRKTDYLKGKGKRTKVTKNPITGRTRTVEKWRDETGKKQKRVSVKQTRGAKNTQEIERKSKVKVGDVNKIKRKKKIDRFGYTEKTIRTRAQNKRGGVGGRKKTSKRHKYRDDPTLKRETVVVRGKEKVKIGGYYRDV